MPDAEAIQYVGTLGGIGAVFGFTILGVAVWFLREFLQRWSKDLEYRRERDDKIIATLETHTATLAKVIERIDRLVYVDRLVERLQAKPSDAASD